MRKKLLKSNNLVVKARLKSAVISNTKICFISSHYLGDMLFYFVSTHHRVVAELLTRIHILFFFSPVIILKWPLVHN